MGNLSRILKVIFCVRILSNAHTFWLGPIVDVYASGLALLRHLLTYALKRQVSKRNDIMTFQMFEMCLFKLITSYSIWQRVNSHSRKDTGSIPGHNSCLSG